MRLTKENLAKRNVKFEHGIFTCLICGCVWSINQKSEQIKQPKNCWVCRNDPNHSKTIYELKYEDKAEREAIELDDLFHEYKYKLATQKGIKKEEV